MLTSGDVGHTMRAAVTASNASGAVSATSAQTAVVAGPPATMASFTYSPGSPVTNQSVHFDGTASICSSAPCSYVWADQPPSGGSWPLGSGQTLDFTFTGVGTKYVALTVTVTVTDALNRSVCAEHDVVVTTATVAASANTALPAISATTTQGPTLSASSGSWSGSPNLNPDGAVTLGVSQDLRVAVAALGSDSVGPVAEARLNSDCTASVLADRIAFTLWWRRFGPASGSDPALADPLARR